VSVADSDLPRSRELLHALGARIHELGGRYLAAEDVGATQADMDGIAEVTPWVTGVDPATGGSGDPSPITALGVVHGMRAAAERVWGDASLAGRRVVVQGVGHVGSRLVALLVADGAEVAVADVSPERADRMRQEHGVAVVSERHEVEEEICDILAPCALGGLLTVESASALRCRVVCGAANNQLADETADDALAARGIVYAPDFVVNAGGIINIAQEWAPGGYSLAGALEAVAKVAETTTLVLDEAARRGRPPGRTAERLARERVRREGRGRFEPGDPAAWTNGAPLTSLRA
jgi:glutamate dehydrogenase/leucine dehydrogenase